MAQPLPYVGHRHRSGRLSGPNGVYRINISYNCQLCIDHIIIYIITSPKNTGQTAAAFRPGPKPMDILIFKTNLHNPELVNQARPVLQNLPGIHRWNVDMHDCDNILRIEAQQLSARAVESRLQDAGYYCEELLD